MATNPKIKPCPKCRERIDLNVYEYENGWKYVECNRCYYAGPGEGSTRSAIKSFNDLSLQQSDTGAN